MKPQIIKIQDQHNGSKIHCYKFYSCGHVYYNQGYSCTEGAYRYCWKRLLKTIGHNGYRKYYNQAIEILNEKNK